MQADVNLPSPISITLEVMEFRYQTAALVAADAWMGTDCKRLRDDEADELT